VNRAATATTTAVQVFPREHAVVVAVAAREDLHQRAPVRGEPVAENLRRQRLARHRLGLERRANLVEHRVERRDQHGPGARAHCRGRTG
jgi:hypothetical protein